VTETPPDPRGARADKIRDVIMLAVLLIWATFGVLSVYQIFRDGSKVLDSLPPFWFWGIPLAPFSALYAPWSAAVRAMREHPQAVTPPDVPPSPEAGA